ncbi:winged helix-turn-helix domain-containing protein [Streptomyces zingiberis]|uniref:Winged helix-turn-helix transcriptional regulator n=1 Tax=Streptomyces zingiberis TaxID=2053010 RepID=A0ABX1BU19_9ACTN|nr:winged helix-turn-helix domain-containing protein [Streptomyces zingiberis]NJQ01214.1 winged helix-turn-helix transcriptional regulator [Streptomyces zingiberis]
MTVAPTLRAPLPETLAPLTVLPHRHHQPGLPAGLALVPEEGNGPATAGDGSPLVGYLVLLPESVDPVSLFAATGLRPRFQRAVTGDAEVTAAPAGGEDAGPLEPEPPAGDPYEPVRVDTERHIAEIDGRELDLTYLEFALLAQLVRHPHRVWSREQLVRMVWGHSHIGDGRTVDVHVARLRRKLGAAHRQRIVTVRRVGYKYVPAAEPRAPRARRR